MAGTPKQGTQIPRKGGNLNIKDLVLSGAIYGFRLAQQILTATAALDPKFPLMCLNHATVIIAATLVAPTAGDLIVITNTSASGTAAHTVTLPAGVTWDGTNRVATFAAPGKTLVAVAVSATRFLILLNIGTVALS